MKNKSDILKARLIRTGAVLKAANTKRLKALKWRLDDLGITLAYARRANGL